MTALIIGAHGKIGRILCAAAAPAGVSVRAMIRDPAQRAVFDALGVPAVVADLEADFAHAYEGCDQVVFTAGSGPHTGFDKTLLIDLYGAVRAIDMAVERGVSHFVMVSALRAHDPLAGPEKLRPYLAAKHVADRQLERSGLRYTLLRPGRLTDEPGTGRVRTTVGDRPDAITISRENVARAALAALAHPPPRSRVFDLLDGNEPIDEALA
jgi:uncharacterized protein YbjT (DUF2867 family)